MFPTDHRECREAFEDAAAGADAVERVHLPTAGPDGEDVWLTVARFGPVDAERVALVMSGVHGVEGAAGSAQQTATLGQGFELPSGSSIVMVHAVNAWGMAWLRRQNERNVDLNRNWADHPVADRNDAYAEVHDLLCPTDDQLPDGDAFVRELTGLSQRHGLDWVRRAISGGQYSHPDGLYFGGTEREASTVALSDIAARHIGRPAELSVLDLHTGHGPYGTATILSRAAPGSAEATWLAATLDGEHIESSAVAEDALVPRSGQLALGLVEQVGPAVARTATLELGTRSETRMITTERAEHWVHMHGDRSNPDHAQVIADHLHCSVPDDAEWRNGALVHGQRVIRPFLQAAVGAR